MEILLHWIDKATLSQDDIQDLMDALKDKAITAPTSVACNCLPGHNCHHHHHKQTYCLKPPDSKQ